MSDWLTDFFTEYVPFCMTTLGIPEDPGTGNINVITTVQGQQHNFVEMLGGRAGPGWTFVPPGLVIDVGDASEAPNELGMAELNLMRAPVTTIYVAKLGGSNTQPFMYSQIFAVKKAIEARPSTFNTFTRIEQGKLLSSVDAPINRELMGDSQVSLIASALVYSPGFLVQLY